VDLLTVSITNFTFFVLNLRKLLFINLLLLFVPFIATIINNIHQQTLTIYIKS